MSLGSVWTRWWRQSSRNKSREELRSELNEAYETQNALAARLARSHERAEHYCQQLQTATADLTELARQVQALKLDKLAVDADLAASERELRLLRDRLRIPFELTYYEADVVGDDGRPLRRRGCVDIDQNWVALSFDGLGQAGAADGCGYPIAVELDRQGVPRLHVWSDIRQEDPTHTISLQGALETNRQSPAER